MPKYELAYYVSCCIDALDLEDAETQAELIKIEIQDTLHDNTEPYKVTKTAGPFEVHVDRTT